MINLNDQTRNDAIKDTTYIPLHCLNVRLSHFIYSGYLDNKDDYTNDLKGHICYEFMTPFIRYNWIELQRVTCI